MQKRSAMAVIVLASAALMACAKAPAIAYDKDSCEHCSQRISDKHYVAEMITSDGKAHKFDSIECMADYITRHKPTYKTLWVSNYEKPGKMLKVEDAVFIQNDRLHSPMGANVAAYRAAARAFLSAQYKGSKAMDWKETQVFLRDTVNSYRFHMLVQ